MSARIGKYDIQAESGDGSSLVRVFRALDRDTGRPVTLKVLTDVTDARSNERFRREVAIAANLRHPNLVAVYELAEHVGLPFAAMQYLGEETLQHAIDTRRSLTLLQKMQILSQVAEGLRAAHGGGLAYVGVQPSGILLDSNGNATIGDFGIVRLTAGERNASAAGPTVTEPPCDILALGAIYYELISGTHPFHANAGGEPVPLRQFAPDYPEALERLVSRALDRHREVRYQTIDELQFDAEPILSELKSARVSVLLVNARRRMAVEQLDEAQAAVREILELDPDNRKAHRLRSALRDVVQRRTVACRVEALRRESDEEAAAGRLDRALEILESAARLDPADPGTANRLEQIRLRVEQSRECIRLMGEARELLERNLPEDARGRVLQALEYNQRSEEAARLLSAIDEAVERRARENRIEQQLAEAKSLLLMKAFDEAIAVLTGLLAESPGSAVVEHWLVHVRTQKAEAERLERLQDELAEAQALIAQARYQSASELLHRLDAEFAGEARIADLAAEATAGMERESAIAQAHADSDRLCGENKFEEALSVLDAALKVYPDDRDTKALARKVEEQRAEFRNATVRDALDEAEWLVEQNRPDLAAQFLREKCGGFSDEPEIRARRAAIEETLPEWERCRLVRDCLDRAAPLEQLGQWSAALAVVEEGLGSCPGSSELLKAAEELRTRLQEQERQKALARRMRVSAQKIAVQAWPEAVSLLKAAESEFPGEPEVKRLLEQAEAGLHTSECESTVTEIRQFLADGDVPQAEELLREAVVLLGPQPAFGALQEEVEAVKKYREEWRAAELFFGRRQFAEAEEILVRLADQNHPEAQALLATVRRSRAASQENDFYQRGREKARKLIQEGDTGQAADLLRNLLSLFPGDPILERDLQAAQGGNDQAKREEAVSAADPAGETDSCEGAEPPPIPPVPERRVVLRLSMKRLRRTRWVPVGVVIFSAAAAIWLFGRPSPAPAPPQKAVARSAAINASTPQPVTQITLPPMEIAPPKAPDPERAKPQPRPAQAPARRFSLPARANPEATRGQAPLATPPGSVPLSPAGTELPASLVRPVNTPPPPAEHTPGSAPEPPAAALQPVRETQPPKAISTPAPEMPVFAKQHGIHGVVNLEATVDVRGRVTSITPVNGDPILVQAAKSAVLRWLFEPAMVNRKPVPGKVAVRLVFEGGR